MASGGDYGCAAHCGEAFYCFRSSKGACACDDFFVPSGSDLGVAGRTWLT